MVAGFQVSINGRFWVSTEDFGGIRDKAAEGDLLADVVSRSCLDGRYRRGFAEAVNPEIAGWREPGNDQQY